MRKFYGLLACALMLAVQMPSGVRADQEGLEFATEVHYRPEGKDYVALTEMILGGQGRERRREMYMYRLDGDRRGDTMGLVRFTEPADIADTGLLTLDYADQEDSDQWVYLPALGRERRVSSERKGGRFANSDLYFEDLRDRDPGKDEHTILRRESLDGKEMVVMESIPRDPDNSVYSKRIGWIDPETLVPMRLDYYMGGSEPVKRYQVNEVRQVEGYWNPVDRTMTDLQGGTYTRMIDREMTYDQGLPERLFTPRSLRSVSRDETRWRP